jgi:hypothetical protein
LGLFENIQISFRISKTLLRFILFILDLKPLG